MSPMWDPLRGVVGRDRDLHGQPLNPYFNARLRMDRVINELLGFCKGLLADGVVLAEEAYGFRTWLRQHPDLHVSFPGNVMCQRIDQIFRDGRVDEEELADLRDLLRETVGEEPEDDVEDPKATRLLFTHPPPDLIFPQRTYVVTGRFVFGGRRAVERSICDRGGTCEDRVTRRMHYLIVGTYASRDWLHASYGTKVRDTIELRDLGHPVAIVAEEHFVKCLQ